MARNRMIKPEFWSDSKTGKLSEKAKLLFIGMWNFSDDEGKINGDALYIRSSILPYSEEIVDLELEELEKELLIVPYVIKRQKYYWIVNFNKHQKIDRPRISQIPNPLIKSKTLREFLFNLCDGICPECDRDMVFESKGSNPPDPYSNSNNSDNEYYVNGLNSRVFSVDHIIPKSKTGNNHPKNLRGLCITCNKKKSNNSDYSSNNRRTIVEQSRPKVEVKVEEKEKEERGKRKVFSPPEFSELKTYFIERAKKEFGDSCDIDAIINEAKLYFKIREDNKWIKANTKKVKNWKNDVGQWILSKRKNLILYKPTDPKQNLSA